MADLSSSVLLERRNSTRRSDSLATFWPCVIHPLWRSLIKRGKRWMSAFVSPSSASRAPILSASASLLNMDMSAWYLLKLLSTAPSHLRCDACSPIGSYKHISTALFRIALDSSPYRGSVVRNTRNSGCGFTSLGSPSASQCSLTLMQPSGSRSELSLSRTEALHRLALSRTSHRPLCRALMMTPSSHSKRGLDTVMGLWSVSTALARTTPTSDVGETRLRRASAAGRISEGSGASVVTSRICRSCRASLGVT